MKKLIRLTNGEQVICYLTEGNENTFLVKYAFLLMYDNDQAKIKFHPFAPFSERFGVLEMRKETVSFVSEPAVELSNSYDDLLNGILPELNQVDE